MNVATPTTPARRRIGRAVLATAAAAALGAAVITPPASAAVDGAADTVERSDRLPIKKLKGEVGPGFTIEINKSQVAAGKYKLTVEDKSSIHNFHITGPGVDEATTVGGTGKTVWKLKLKPGTYDIVCDPHSGTMKTTLTVT
jgi:plastocyanin